MNFKHNLKNILESLILLGKIYPCEFGDSMGRLVEKTRGWKSRSTVPLTLYKWTPSRINRNLQEITDKQYHLYWFSRQLRPTGFPT
jgi:hypothetical protein